MTLPLASLLDGHADLALWVVLLCFAGLLLVAHLTGLAYPIVLVAGGAAIGFLTGVHVDVSSDLVLLVLLPPLVYSAAFFTSPRELAANARPLTLLAVGLVAFNTFGIGALAYVLVPDLTWPAAFTLGAVLSPTDPVAATAIASRVGASRRFETIIEGESLLHDATALICLQFAIAATVTGSFSVLDALGTFAWSAAAGLAIGIAGAYLAERLRRLVHDDATEIAVSLATPYFVYLPAEALGASAILAAVAAGLFLGWRSPRLLGPGTRLQSYATWTTLSYVLNAVLFVLVGLQLPDVLSAISGQYGTTEVLGYAAGVTAAVLAIRMVWVFPATYLPRLSPGLRERDPAPALRETFLVGFTGMRGAVSLAAALSVPLTVEGGGPFPGRDLLVFLTYVVILVTVVAQGLALGPLIRRLGLQDPRQDEQEAEDRARLAAARAALDRLDELADEDWTREQTVERLRGQYAFRVRRFSDRYDEEADDDAERGSQAYQRLRREVLEAERETVVGLRDRGEITDDLMRRIERDLDLEDQRLEI